MQTKMENMQKYIGYTKCGEILKPPSGGYHRPYVLKCFHCKEIYLLFEAFIYHIEDDCKSLIADGPNKDYVDETVEGYSITEPLELGDKNVKVDTEKNCMPMVDPLVIVKSELFSENDEPSSTIRNSSNNDEDKLSTEEDLGEKDFTEISKNSEEDLYQSSEEDIADVSDELTEDEVYEMKTEIGQKDDLGIPLESSNFVTNFLKNKDNVMAFIGAFKSQPSLWNRNYPYLRTKVERQNCFQEIADEFNKSNDLSISWTEVRNFIVYLCRTYREDLKYLNEIKDSRKSYTPSWFFEHLNFLKPFMEKNHIASLDSHLPDLFPNQIIEILKIYKELPQLWNTQIIEHYCKNKMDSGKKDMLQALKAKLDIKVAENVLEKYIRTINKCFKRARHNEMNKQLAENNSDGTSIEEHKLDNYYKHMSFLEGHVGRFNCSECKRPFKNPMYLKIHQNNVHGFEPFPCSQCKKTFKSVTAYTNHAKRHMQDLNYGCKECDKKFLYSKDLEIHMRRHDEVKPFCCEICGVSFRHSQTFKTHHRRHVKNYLHTCELCGKGFYTKDRYRDHMNSHSNTRNQKCKVCGKAFITKKSLQQHVVIHDDIRRYSCHLCGKTFKQKTGVNQHMRTHGTKNNEERSAANRK